MTTGSVGQSLNMNAASVDTLLALIRSSEPYVVPGKLTPPMSLHSSVLPAVGWNAEEIEQKLQVTLPQHLKDLWNHASEIRLLEDVNYGQWGCILWSPFDVVAEHGRARSLGCPEDERSGDLIVGKFRGDADVVIVRCDPASPDFGAVVIGLRTDARQDWPLVAHSVVEFASRFLECPTRKYWERQR